jgi:hypothetical protein
LAHALSGTLGGVSPVGSKFTMEDSKTWAFLDYHDYIKGSFDSKLQCMYSTVLTRNHKITKSPNHDISQTVVQYNIWNSILKLYPTMQTTTASLHTTGIEPNHSLWSK